MRRPNVRRLLRRKPSPIEQGDPSKPTVLILTPVKDATSHLLSYFKLLFDLTYPHQNISLGMLEGDSEDGTFDALQRSLPILRKEFRQVGMWKQDFGFRFPYGLPRSLPELQLER